jgi:hypothetical protein
VSLTRRMQALHVILLASSVNTVEE